MKRLLVGLLAALVVAVACVTRLSPPDGGTDVTVEAGVEGGHRASAAENYAIPVGPAGSSPLMCGQYPGTLEPFCIPSVCPPGTFVGGLDGGTFGCAIPCTADGGCGSVQAFTAGGDLYGTPTSQQVNTITPDGGIGALVTVNGQGFAANPIATDFGLKYANEAGVASIPGDIDFTAQRPNKGASSTSTGSPGEINENMFHPVSTGAWPTWNVVAADDCTGGVGCSYLWAMGQVGPDIALPDGGVEVPPSAYLWGPVAPGGSLTTNNYVLYTSYGTNGTTNLNAPGYITLNVGNNLYEGIDIFKPGIGQVTAITAAGGSTIGMSAFVFNYPSVNPVYGIIPTISNVATTSVSLIGQSSNVGASGANLNGGPVAVCGGEHAGSSGAVDGVVTRGAGYALTTYAQCNVTATTDAFGDLYQGSTTPTCVSGKGRIGADATGNMWGCDSSGSAYRLNGGSASTSGVYGSGSDGAMVLDGTNTYAVLQLVGSGPNSIYAPLTDVFATSIIVNNTITLLTNAAIHASSFITVNTGGLIDCNSGKPGQPGSGTSAGGNAVAPGTLGGGYAGGNGGNGGGVVGGTPGSTSTNSFVTAALSAPQGGSGGSSSSGSGGNGGAVNTVGARILSQPAVSTGVVQSGANPPAPVAVWGGSGGGGGASNGSGAAGGGGGSSAGICTLLAPVITNNGTIHSIGGAGGAALAGGTNAGGGGGGPGGGIFITSNSYIGANPVVLGGAGGAGAGSGGLSGQAGANGMFVIVAP